MAQTSKRTQWIFWGTCLGYACFAAWLLIAFHAPSPYRSSWANPRFASTLYVRKWNLYTADPSRRVEQLYKVEGNKLRTVDLRPFTPEYKFGLSRLPKIIAQEIQVITRDTALLATAPLDTVTADHETPITKLVQPDKLLYTTVRYKNVVFLRGRYILQIYPPLTRDDVKQHRTAVPMRLLAVNIEAP